MNKVTVHTCILHVPEVPSYIKVFYSMEKGLPVNDRGLFECAPVYYIIRIRQDRVDRQNRLETELGESQAYSYM